MIKNIILDVDSTVLGAEILETLFLQAFPEGEERDSLLKKVEQITNLGMSGQILFNESLQRRVAMLSLTKKLLKQTASELTFKISRSFIKNLGFLKAYNIVFISGAFMEIILPLLKPLGFKKEQVFANNFKFIGREFAGVEENNPLAKPKGKVKVAKNLGFKAQETIVIGDGFTDYEIKKAGLAKAFIYYEEFVTRESVKELANFVVQDFDELVALFDNKLIPAGIQMKPLFIN